jgi:hypothetical protein
VQACLELYGDPGSDQEAAASALVWATWEGTAKTNSVRSFIDRLREEWLEKSLEALRADPDFFRRLANILEAKQREPHQDTAHFWNVFAYSRLYENPLLDPAEITKKQVRELSRRYQAFWRLCRDGKIKDSFKDNFGPEQEALLAREIKLLPPVRWQNEWKRPEFKALKDAKRGRKPGNCGK